MKKTFFTISVSCLMLLFMVFLFQSGEKTESNQVLRIAHRGYCENCMENTLASVLAAKLQGADMVEMDVRLTADGVAVLYHDGTLQRLFGMEKSVEECSYNELSTLGGKEKFAKKRIPTLEEVLQFCDRNNLPAMIELKASANDTQLIEKTLQVILQNHRECLCVLACQNHSVLSESKKRCGNIETAYITRNLPINTQIMTNTDIICLRKTAASKTTVSRIKELGKTVFVWTENDSREGEMFIKWGIDGIITDNGRILKKEEGEG